MSLTRRPLLVVLEDLVINPPICICDSSRFESFHREGPRGLAHPLKFRWILPQALENAKEFARPRSDHWGHGLRHLFCEAFGAPETYDDATGRERFQSGPRRAEAP